MIERDTARLRLRQWDERDFEPFAAFYADPELAKFVGGRTDREQAWRRFAAEIGHWALRGFGYWAVEEKQTGRFVGAAGLWHSPGWPELELGYWLVRDGQARGYATEAAAESRDYAFEALGSRTLVSYIHPDNEPSKRVAERLGARLDSEIDLASYGRHLVYRYPAPSGSLAGTHAP